MALSLFYQVFKRNLSELPGTLSVNVNRDLLGGRLFRRLPG